MSIEREVAWGESAEWRIAERWRPLSKLLRGVSRLEKGPDYADYDFLAYGSSAELIGFVEIKCRRTPFKKYGDAMFPRRKMMTARVSSENLGLPTIGVTEYSCGTLVEVSLASRPSSERPVKRFDRDEFVPHVFYKRELLTVLEPA